MSSHDYKKKEKFNKNIKIKRLETNKVLYWRTIPNL